MSDSLCRLKRPRLSVSKTGSDYDDDDKLGEEQKHDRDYFKSYSDVSVHEEMLSDVVRTNAYRYAILKNYESLRGKTVLDVGAGTGILSIFCVQAGARTVHAVEASDMAPVTRQIVEENKMSQRIHVYQEKMEEATIPEKVDAIVSEWMGYCMLYESMLNSVIVARDLWLKPAGLMYPETASLFLAAFTDEDYVDSRLEFWDSIKSTYRVSMDCMKSFSRKCIASNVHVKCLNPENIVSSTYTLASLDLYTVTSEDLGNIRCDFNLDCFGSADVHGFVTWFSVDFPGKTTLTTSPYSEETHWGQTLLYVEKPFHVEQNNTIKGSITFAPNRARSRFLDIETVYKCNTGACGHQRFHMNDSLC